MELSSTHFLTVSKVHVIERKYQKHRESLLKAKSSVYCHEDNDQHRFMAVNQRKVIDSVYKVK